MYLKLNSSGATQSVGGSTAGRFRKRMSRPDDDSRRTWSSTSDALAGVGACMTRTVKERAPPLASSIRLPAAIMDMK